MWRALVIGLLPFLSFPPSGFLSALFGSQSCSHSWLASIYKPVKRKKQIIINKTRPALTQEVWGEGKGEEG